MRRDKSIRPCSSGQLVPFTYCSSDAGLVMLPRRPYILALMTKFDPQQDDRRLVDLIRTIHAALVRLDQSNELGHAVYSYGV